VLKDIQFDWNSLLKFGAHKMNFEWDKKFSEIIEVGNNVNPVTGMSEKLAS